jgi:hypothetical protein
MGGVRRREFITLVGGVAIDLRRRRFGALIR